MNVLVLNTGSSSVKFSVVASADERLLLDGLGDWSLRPGKLVVSRPGRPAEEAPLPAEKHVEALRHILERLARAGGSAIDAVGHRVVHGGPKYTAAVRITPAVRDDLAALADLAPLHAPVNVEGIDAAQAVLPDVPHVAAFDTAFHATLPEYARTYAVPHAWTAEWGVRRYGFHGLSHDYCSNQAARMLGRGPDGLRVVVCHLGNGCSASAVKDGKCQDTSMGFTPLDGLVMGTRSGSVDPGLLLYALRDKGVTADELDAALNRGSGLLGVSGVSGDMREVQAAARGGHARARLALDVYAHAVRKTVGALAAVLGGVDALVFTAGVGEHSAEMRASACRGLEHLGLELDPAANAACRPDADVAAARSRGRVLVVATREDLTIVREAVRILG
jgi:acetate kinase